MRLEVQQRWKHRTTNPAHQDYGRIVRVEEVGPSHVVVKGEHRSTWSLAAFRTYYAYYDTPTHSDPIPDADPVFEQLTLDLGDLVEPAYEPTMTIAERFDLFHAANPWVLRAYEKLTADWLAQGERRAGIGMFTEIIRWQYGRQTTGSDFKINNNYRSRYARLILERNPGWDGVFETRELRTK